MNFLTTIVLATLSSAATTPLCNQPGQLCPIEGTKYLGDWYEIGATQIIRNTFERDCDCVLANYVLKNATEIAVTNSCINPKTKKPSTIVGTAKILSSSQLKVSFGDNSLGGRIGLFFQNLSKDPNYVVSNVWVDEKGNYQRALVTSPLRKGVPAFIQKPLEFTWILSRTPAITQAEIDETLAYAVASGYHPKEAGFRLTDQVTCRK
ncbi:Calycin-like protein [Globomyces pollinis-pini]|nr:Calycin-like protein [Globomyces pollinis-pini]